MRRHLFDHLSFCVRCGVSAERVRRGEVEEVCVFDHERYRDRHRERPNEMVHRLARRLAGRS